LSLLNIVKKIKINELEGDFNPVLTKEYRDYKYEIYLDAERECLSGEILGLNGWYDSDSLTHLIEQIERRIDEEIHYKFHNQLVEDNVKLRDWAKLHNW